LRKNEYENNNKSLSLFDTNKYLTKWKNEKPILNTIYSQVLQDVQVRVDLAFKNFFRRIKRKEKCGFPRFKGYGRYDSITYTQSGFKILNENYIYASKIGNIKIKGYRPQKGKVKIMNINRSGNNKWFVNFVCEYNNEQYNLPKNNCIGLDLGINNFMTLSNNTKKDNPKFYKHEEKELKKAYKKFSKTGKNIYERKKKLKILKRIYERIGNKRKDFCHKASNTIIKKYDIICVENLNIKNMFSNNKTLNKNINDVAWNMFINQLEYKAEEAGKQVIRVNPCNTSKTCSRCGIIKDHLELSERIFYCIWCGLEIDRDHNASINILRLGLQSDFKEALTL